MTKIYLQEIKKCEQCDEKITKDTLKYRQEGTATFELSIRKTPAYIDYELFNFEPADGGEWYCDNCMEALPLDFEEGEFLYLRLNKKA